MNDAIKGFIDQLDVLEDEKLGIKLQIDGVLKSAQEAGHDPSVLKELVKMHRMDKATRDKLQERDRLIGQYAMDLGFI